VSADPRPLDPRPLDPRARDPRPRDPRPLGARSAAFAAVSADTRALAALYAGFGAGVVLVALLHAPAKGWVVLGLVVAFNLALPLLAVAVERRDWLALWAFLLPVSIFQILPDWILVDTLRTLRFPVIGGPRIDHAINLAMGGMWVPPLFIVLSQARGRPGLAALLALAVFFGSELLAPVLALWKPVGTDARLAGVALYVLPAEAALGWAAVTAYAGVEGASVTRRLAAALAVSTFYLGALVLAHFLIDTAGWTITV
jgi:hypothetical protein